MKNRKPRGLKVLLKSFFLPIELYHKEILRIYNNKHYNSKVKSVAKDILDRLIRNHKRKKSKKMF